MLRLSQYVFRVDPLHASHALLINGATGILLEVTPSVADLLLPRCRLRPPVDGDGEWLAQLDRVAGPELIQELTRKRFLTLLSPDEEVRGLDATLRDAAKRTPSAIVFWLVPTYQCNLRCTYCYMFSPESRVPRGLGNYRAITDDMVAAAFDAMLKIEPDHTKCRLSLTGGEPLQKGQLGTIRNILSRAQTRGYSVSIISNGVDLDFFLAELRPQFIKSIQITLDGPKDIHDQRRVRKAPTFDKITGNITKALDKGITVAVRVHVDRTTLPFLPQLSEVMEASKWFERPNFQAYVSLLHGCGLSQEDVNQFAEEHDFHPSLWRLQYRCDSRKFVTPLLAQNSLRAMTAYCGKQTGMYVFDPLGHIYDCISTLGYVEESVGKYGPGLLTLYEDRIAEAHRRTLTEIPECMRCPFVLMCGGGCEFQSRSWKPGSVTLPYKPDCAGLPAAVVGEIRRTYPRFKTLRAVQQFKPIH